MGSDEIRYKEAITYALKVSSLEKNSENGAMELESWRRQRDKQRVHITFTMLHDCCWLIGATRRGKLTLVRSRCSDAIYSKSHSGIWIPEFLLFFQYAIQLIWYIMVIINHLLWWFIKFLSYLYLYITKYNIYAWHEHLFEHPLGVWNKRKWLHRPNKCFCI